MPFQSEKQRKYLHVNHPEIAKRWEKEYSNGGISNFRKKFKKGSYSRSYNPGAGGVVQHGPTKTHHGGGGGGGGGPPSVVHKPKGPTAAEIAAAKAKAEAEKRRLEALAHKKYVKDFKDTQKKKIKLKSKWDTPEWDTDIVSVSLEDFKPNKTLDDYYNQLDETDVPLSDWEQKHMEELEKKNQLELIDEIKEKEGISNEKLMYPPPGNLAELTEKQKKFIDKKTFPLKENLVSPESVYKTITNPDLGVYDKGIFGIGAQEPTTIEEYNEYLKSKKLPVVTAVGAKGGVARKKYSTGGVLDITGEEEITTEEGNDISLVDESETGVSTLFRAKDGGTPQLAKKSKDGTRPGYRGSDWAGDDNQNDFSGMDSGGWDPGVSSPGTTSTGGNVNTGGGDQEDDVAQMMSNMNITPDHSPNYTGSDLGWVASEDEETEIGGADYIGPKDKVRIHNDIINRKNKFDSTWEKTKRAGSAISSFMSITNPFMFAKFVYDQNKKKNERIAEIDADLELLDKIGATKFTPHTNTIYQKLEQEKLDLIQPRSRDEDTGGDGPEVPVVKPVTEEIGDSYAMVGDWMSRIRGDRWKVAYLDKLERQAAELQENRDFQENTMFLNSGGLANLFRVKN